MTEYYVPSEEAESAAVGKVDPAVVEEMIDQAQEAVKPLCPIPCFVCGEHLTEVDEEGINQPHGAQTFVSGGHYGATLFDPMDGSWLELNICDECIKVNAARGRILVGSPRPQRLAPPPTYRIWSP